jgi:H+-transporting ATPase
VKPAKSILLAVIVTQLVATIITVYGILLPATGWGLALLVWVYALSLFIVTEFEMSLFLWLTLKKKKVHLAQTENLL